MRDINGIVSRNVEEDLILEELGLCLKKNQNMITLWRLSIILSKVPHTFRSVIARLFKNMRIMLGKYELFINVKLGMGHWKMFGLRAKGHGYPP